MKIWATARDNKKFQKKLTKQILEWTEEKSTLERVEETISEASNTVEECSTKRQ